MYSPRYGMNHLAAQMAEVRHGAARQQQQKYGSEAKPVALDIDDGPGAMWRAVALRIVVALVIGGGLLTAIWLGGLS